MIWAILAVITLIVGMAIGFTLNWLGMSIVPASIIGGGIAVLATAIFLGWLLDEGGGPG